MLLLSRQPWYEEWPCGWCHSGSLGTPIGLVDRPVEQRSFGGHAFTAVIPRLCCDVDVRYERRT